MLKNKEELIKQNIQEVINSWDPIGLMNICPEDEYEPEINEIVEFVICNKNINKILLSEEIRKIFNFYFTSIYNSINEVEEDVARRIENDRNKGTTRGNRNIKKSFKACKFL